MLRMVVHSMGLQQSRWNIFILSSWWKTSAWKYSSNDKEVQRCWDGSKCKVLSSFLDWYKPLPGTAELPPDILLSDFLQAGWAPILQTAARCCQQKGYCHINGTFGFSLTLSPNQAEYCQQLVLHKPELVIRQKWCERRNICLSYNLTSTTGSLWTLRNLESMPSS